MALRYLILAAVAITVQCSVIKIQEIQISDDMLMKIVIKEGSSDQSHKIASIKIDLEKPEEQKYNKHHSEEPAVDLPPEEEAPTHPRFKPAKPQVNDGARNIEDFLSVFNLGKDVALETSTPATTPTEDDETNGNRKPIPSLEDRFGIGSDNCGEGKVRRGSYCIPVGK